MDDPISAAAANQTDVLKLIKPFFANLAVDTTVPMTEHILLLPRDRWAGIPAIIKAGREIRPPPLQSNPSVLPEIPGDIQLNTEPA